MPTVNRDKLILDPAFEAAAAAAATDGDAATGGGSQKAAPDGSERPLQEQVERILDVQSGLPEAAKGPPLPAGVGADAPEDADFRPPPRWAEAAEGHATSGESTNHAQPPGHAATPASDHRADTSSGPDAPAIPEASGDHSMADEMVGYGQGLGAGHDDGAAHRDGATRGSDRSEDAGRPTEDATAEA
jgi:hypothetical protein